MKVITKKISAVLSVILLSLVCFSNAYGNQAELDAQQVLEKVDEYRNFKNKAFSFDLELVSQKPKKEPKVFTMHAKVLNSHVSLVSYQEPRRERGKALLMNQSNLWFLSNSSKKPIRITPQQRLLGEASNGDVASTDFSGDYQASFLDAADQSAPEITLQLNAKPGAIAAYERIVLFVDQVNYKPLRATFYAKSGKKLKTAYYEEFLQLSDVGEGIGNKPQLTKIRIENELKKGNVTSMTYSNFQLEKLSLAQFQPNQIKRLMTK